MPTNVHLLGSPYIEDQGKTVSVDTRKALALLAYLVITGRRQSRDTLGALLWSENDDSGARAALRRTLSTLKKAVGDDSLDADRDTIEFVHNSDLWIDVAEFEQRITAVQDHEHGSYPLCSDCMDKLAEASAVYRDDFMAGFTLRDSVAFDDWQFAQTERLRRNLIWALSTLVDGYIGRGAYAEALQFTQRWLAVDPLHEAAHRTMMQLYAWTGQRSSALQQYRQCVRVLDQELGVAPLEITTKLYAAIRENRLSPPAAQSYAKPHIVQSKPIADPSAPLVGRQVEWQVITRALQQAQSNRYLLVLEGEPGIGKTRLLTEIIQHHWQNDQGKLHVKCFEGESNLAYGMIVNLLDRMLQPAATDDLRWMNQIQTRTISEVARLYPEILKLRKDVPTPEPDEGELAQTRLFEAFSALLHAYLTRFSAGILAIDNVHQADNASIDLLNYVIRRLATQPVLIILTWLSDATLPHQNLHRVVLASQQEGWGQTLKLRRLALADVGELITKAELPKTISTSDLIQRLHQETEGLPFFIVEYLNSLAINAHDLAQDWQVPLNVQELLRSRVTMIDDLGQQLLSTAAVIGHIVDFDTLKAVGGRSEEEVIVSIEQFIAAGLIVEMLSSSEELNNGINYGFYHSKLRTLLYNEMTSPRRRLLHRRVGDFLSKGIRDDASSTLLGQIAAHYEQAREDEKAARYYLNAAAQARVVYANHEALLYLQNALALGHHESAKTHFTIGKLYTLLGQYGNALGSFEISAALSEDHEITAIEYELGKIYHRLGEWDLAESHFQTALDLLSSNDPLQAKILANWCLTAHRRGDNLKAMGLAQQSFDIALPTDDKLALSQALNMLGILERHQGETTKAIANFEQSLALATDLSDLGAQVATLNNLALTFFDQNNLDNALELTTQALTLCQQHGDRHLEAALHSNLADLLHASGEQERAMEHLRLSATILTEMGKGEPISRPEIWKLIEW